MKTHKAPRDPGMHSLHDPKSSSHPTSHKGISNKTIVIIVASFLIFLVLMYLMMAV